MAENVISAVVGEAVSTAASIIKNKFDKLSKLSEKVEELEWKVLKIKSAVEESKKYDIDNEPLREMQQKFICAAQEGEDALRKYKNRYSTIPDPQSSVQSAVMPSNSTIISVLWKMLIYGIVSLPLVTQTHHLVDELINGIRLRILLDDFITHTLHRVGLISNEVRDFLEMVRQQRRKRGRRRRYRPYKCFFTLILHYCRLQVSWMRLLFKGMAIPVYRESKLIEVWKSEESAFPIGQLGLVVAPISKYFGVC